MPPGSMRRQTQWRHSKKYFLYGISALFALVIERSCVAREFELAFYVSRYYLVNMHELLTID